MKMKFVLTTIFLLSSLITYAQKSKWIYLFDGKNTDQWHSWHSNEVKGWSIINGELTTNGKSKDLLTNKEYENFRLEFEFKVQEKGNSGIIYKVTEDSTNKNLFDTYASGPEYQIIDDANYPMKITDKQKTGANYDIYPPSDLTIVKPAGEWNKGMIIINNNQIEHWLNGKKVASYEYGSVKWKDDVEGSKFVKWPYATAHKKGKIALQGHGDTVWFRKIKIKELN